MTRSTTNLKGWRWLVVCSTVCAFAVLSTSGCGGLRKDKEPAYKSAKANNPLEVPPDLTAVPPSPGTSIPTASGEPVVDEQTQQQKFKKWKEFEEFEKWKQQSGEEQSEFEAFQKFKRQSAGGTDTSLSALNTLDDEQAYAAIESTGTGQLHLRIKDTKDNAWPLIAQSIEQTGAHIQKKNRGKGRITVIPAKYWSAAGAGQKLASLFKKPKNRLEIVIAEANDTSKLKIIPVAGTNKDDADDLVRQLHQALNSSDSDAAT
jgi:uncharacterized lipoprotein